MSQFRPEDDLEKEGVAEFVIVREGVKYIEAVITDLATVSNISNLMRLKEDDAVLTFNTSKDFYAVRVKDIVAIKFHK